MIMHPISHEKLVKRAFRSSCLVPVTHNYVSETMDEHVHEFFVSEVVFVHGVLCLLLHNLRYRTKEMFGNISA